MLEVESSNTCDTGVAEEAEVHWEEDKQAKLARCSNLKHTFQRTARDCPDVKFLLLEVRCPGWVLHIHYNVSHADLMPNEIVCGPPVFCDTVPRVMLSVVGLLHSADAFLALQSSHPEGATHGRAGS